MKKLTHATLAASMLAAGFLPSYAFANEGEAPAEEQPTEVSGVVVTAPQREDDYEARTTRIGRSLEEPRNVPQSLTIVPEALIEDRGADTVREALRNVTGVTFNAGEGGRVGDNITIRGYSAVGDLYLDGVRDVAQYNRETFNLEQIEVLRGSASVLFGRGSTGGVINQDSKDASLTESGELTAIVGSYDYYRATLDVNRRLGPTTGARLNAMITDAGSFREGAELSRWGVAPTVRTGIGTADEIWVSGYYLDESNVPDFGVPFYQGLPAPIPTDQFLGIANADFEDYQTLIVTGGWLHRFDASSELRVLLRAGRFDREVVPSAPRFSAASLASTGGVLTPNTVVTRSRPGREGRDNTVTLQADYFTGYELFGLQNRIQGGVELLNERADGVRFGQAPGVVIPSTTVGAPNIRPTLPNRFFVRNVTQETEFDADTRSVYLQNSTELGRGLRLVLGGRFDEFSADYVRVGPLDDYSRTDRDFSWRAALLYQPDERQSYYVSAGTSFNPSGELYALDPRGANTDPEENRNYEIGARFDLLDNNLMLRGSIFRSEKLNERNTDPLIPDVYLLSGRRRTDGIEFEAAGRITQDWQVFGGVAFFDAEVVDAINVADRGKRPINTPDYTANFWTTWQVTPRFMVGGGFEAVGDRYTSLANTTLLPAYVRWDAVATYKIDRLEFQLNLLNAFDETYYEGLYTGHAVPGTARSVRLGVDVYF